MIGGCLSLVIAAASQCHGQDAGDSRYDTIAAKGDALPGGSETYNFFSNVVMSNGGDWIGFDAQNTGNANRGVFRYSAANETIDQIIAEGQALSGGNFTMTTTDRRLSVNNNGTVAFNGNLTGTGSGLNDTGFYSGSGGAITELVREGNAAPGGSGGTFGQFGATSFFSTQFRGINDLGQTFYHDQITDSPGGLFDDSRFYRVGPTSPVAIATEGDIAPGGGAHVVFGFSEMNDIGEALVTGSVSGSNLGTKIWHVDSGGSMTELVNFVNPIAGVPTNTPVGELITGNSFASLNNSGDVAFVGWTTAGGVELADTHLFRIGSNGGPVSVLLSENTAAPDSNGVFANLNPLQPRLNDAGQYASGFDLRDTAGGTADDSGIFRVDLSGNVMQMFREGQAAINGNGTFGSLSGAAFAFNDAGNVAMQVNYAGTAGGTADNKALVITDGIDTFEIARKGAMVGGDTVFGVAFSNSVYGNDRSTSGLNDFGQVAYIQSLSGSAGQSVQMWTPELHHRGGDSSFSDSSNWTLSLGPAHVHDVFMDSSTDSIVTMSGVQTVKSLQVGGGLGMATLDFGAGAELNVLETLAFDTNGSIIMGENSSLNVAALTGAGSIIGNANSTVFVEELLSPGMSPGQLEITGGLELGSAATTLIELGGLNDGEFDQLFGMSNLELAGDLSVELYDGFSLAEGMEFTVFDVMGTSSGQFNGLGEGSLVGNFSGTDLFISYSANGGNSVSLFTNAVPEPGSLAVLALTFGGLAFRRRRI